MGPGGGFGQLLYSHMLAIYDFASERTVITLGPVGFEQRFW